MKRILIALPLLGLVAGCGGGKGGGSYAASAATTPAAAPAAVVVSTKHAAAGTILAAGPRHLTVYLFEGDSGAASSCTGACAQAWPPVTGTPQAGGATAAAMLGTIHRADGTTQVTYDGHPLYFYTADKDDGDAYGQGIKSFGADWYVVAPSGGKVDNS